MSPSWQGAKQNVAGTGSKRKLRENISSNKHEADQELEVGEGYKIFESPPQWCMSSFKALPPHSLSKQPL